MSSIVSSTPLTVQLISMMTIGGCSASPSGVGRLLDPSLPGWPARYISKSGMTWTDTVIDAEMCRHHTSLTPYLAIPSLVARLDGQTMSTVLLS